VRWTDTQEIAVALAERYPDIDTRPLRYGDLHEWVMGLDGFKDDQKAGVEKALAAIQAAWIEHTA
jgi:FeS assembly protein IscX